MQYKCMERQIRNLHGRILFSICHVYRDNSGRNAALSERNQKSLYTGFWFSPPASPEARHTDWLGYHPCFCAVFGSMKKAVPHGLLFFIIKTPDWSHTYAR